MKNKYSIIDFVEEKSNYIKTGLIKDQIILSELYSLADVFLICSNNENFPTTCIEAQCCGTPVVGFEAGGTKETSVLGEDDFVRYDDMANLERKVLEILDTENHVADLAYKRYSQNMMGENYYKLYKNDKSLNEEI